MLNNPQKSKISHFIPKRKSGDQQVIYNLYDDYGNIRSHNTTNLDRLNVIVNQLKSFKQISSSREEGIMSDTTHDKISAIESRVSVIETDIKHLGNSMIRIEGKLDKVLDKFDSVVTKESLKEKLDTFKWSITIVVSLVAIVATVLSRFIKV